MATGRRVRPDEADRLLREWQESGESMSTWCAARGLSWYSLSAHKGWRGARSAPVETGFAEVVVRDGYVPEPGRQARYRVEVGEVTVEVGDDFHVETLQRLLRAVAAC